MAAYNGRRDNVWLLPPPPGRFTETQWRQNTRDRFRYTDHQHELASSVLTEGNRVRDATEERAEEKLDETNHRLDEKLLELRFRQSELLKIRKLLTDELDDNSCFMDRMHDCMDHIRKVCLEQNRRCITIREGRLGIDLACDKAECELRREKELMEGGIDMLERMMEKMKEESRELRATRYILDRDLCDLEQSLKIDEYNRQLRPTDLNLSLYQGGKSLDNSAAAGSFTGSRQHTRLKEYTVSELMRQERLDLDKSAKRAHNAQLLKGYTDTLMRQLYEDCKAQKAAVDEAILTHIRETKDAKEKLELRHAETMRLANEQTKEITRIDKALADKERFMALTHTRLGNRAQRFDHELSKDAVQGALIDETAKLVQSVHELQAQRIECEASLRYLLKNQIQLEEDINVKANTIKLDEVECMPIRHAMAHHGY